MWKGAMGWGEGIRHWGKGTKKTARKIFQRKKRDTRTESRPIKVLGGAARRWQLAVIGGGEKKGKVRYRNEKAFKS